MEVQLFEGVEPDPSVETVMKGAEAMREFRAGLDRMLWVVDHRSMQQKLCGHSMSIRISHLKTLITPFSFPELRQKAKFCCNSFYIRNSYRSYSILCYHKL